MKLETVDRLPPQAVEMETHVLGAALLDRDAAGAVFELLKSADFYRDAHQTIFQVALELYDREQTLDQALLREELKARDLLEEVGGVSYLAELVGSVPTTAHVEQYAALVKDRALARRVIAAATDTVRAGYAPGVQGYELLAEAEARLFKVGASTAGEVHDVRQLLHDVFRQLEAAREAGGAPAGIATGFRAWDSLTGGLQREELVILAARPSMGKTSLALNVAANVAAAGTPVAVFSLEVSAGQVARNLAASIARVDSRGLRTGMIPDDDWDRLVNIGFAQLRKLPIFIDAYKSSPEVTRLRARARRLVSKQRVGLVVVDYLQLLHGPAELARQSREREVSFVSSSLKGLARELGVPVLACCQLNRQVEARADKRPQLSDLRESGAIEQDADLVLLLHRPGIYKSPPDLDAPATVRVAKNRNGPTDEFQLTFLRRFLRFEDYAPAHGADR